MSRWKTILAALAGGVVVGAIVFLLVVQRSDNRADERLQGATFRLCARQNNDRAFAHSVTRPAALALARKRLPILDCEPNLSGRPARVMPDADQREFVRRFVAGDLTRAETGICREPLSSRSGSKPPAC